MLQPKVKSFESVENLKSWIDEIDKYLIYKIGTKEYVFKTSKLKLDFASKINSIDHYLNEEFCFFDGKTDRVTFFTLYEQVFITHFQIGKYQLLH